MAQLPFDDDGARHVWSVSDLLQHVRRDLEGNYPMLWVRGEISGFRGPAGGGHWYFNLKDDRGTLSAAIFRQDNERLRFTLEDGMEVVAGGRLSLYAPGGRFQMVANTIEPVGWGALQAAFEQLRRRLDSEGLFDPARKRPLPRLPACVGVVTSESGAAWRDMVRVWRRRGVTTRILLSPSRVQGESAAAEVVAALQLLQDQGDAEVIIVGRGGGSPEDLWTFNDERVARAIADCRVPVIAAIGHEIDVTIADLVADSRAATPTAAAEIVAAARDQLLGEVATLASSCTTNMRWRVMQARNRLQATPIDRALRRPGSLLQTYQQRLDQAWDDVDDRFAELLRARRRRLDRAARSLERARPDRLLALRRAALAATVTRAGSAMADALRRRQQRLGIAAARVNALSPLAILGRGYAICVDNAGNVLRRADETRPGARVRVRLLSGALGCEVREVEPPDDSRP